MSVLATQAALELKTASTDISSHKLISLLMSGAIERIEQTKTAALDNDFTNKEILWPKVIAIVNGLRDSLDFEAGGQIAENLNTVYSYLLNRFDEVLPAINDSSCSHDEVKCLEEAYVLIEEIRNGWDSIDASAPEAIAC